MVRKKSQYENGIKMSNRSKSRCSPCVDENIGNNESEKKYMDKIINLSDDNKDNYNDNDNTDADADIFVDNMDEEHDAGESESGNMDDYVENYMCDNEIEEIYRDIREEENIKKNNKLNNNSKVYRKKFRDTEDTRKTNDTKDIKDTNDMNDDYIPKGKSGKKLQKINILDEKSSDKITVVREVIKMYPHLKKDENKIITNVLNKSDIAITSESLDECVLDKINLNGIDCYRDREHKVLSANLELLGCYQKHGSVYEYTLF